MFDGLVTLMVPVLGETGVAQLQELPARKDEKRDVDAAYRRLVERSLRDWVIPFGAGVVRRRPRATRRDSSVGGTAVPSSRPVYVLYAESGILSSPPSGGARPFWTGLVDAVPDTPVAGT